MCVYVFYICIYKERWSLFYINLSPVSKIRFIFALFFFIVHFFFFFFGFAVSLFYPPQNENTRYKNRLWKIVNSGFGGKTMRYLFKYLTQNTNVSLLFFFFSICFLFIYYIKKQKKTCCMYYVKLTKTCYSTCVLLLFCWFWLLPLSLFVSRFG